MTRASDHFIASPLFPKKKEVPTPLLSQFLNHEIIVMASCQTQSVLTADQQRELNRLQAKHDHLTRRILQAQKHSAFATETKAEAADFERRFRQKSREISDPIEWLIWMFPHSPGASIHRMADRLMLGDFRAVEEIQQMRQELGL